MWRYISGVPKVVDEKKNEKNPKAAPGPSQPLFPELEEEEDEDEVLFREKADDDGEDEGVILDYESEAEMSEEMVLDKVEKFLL